MFISLIQIILLFVIPVLLLYFKVIKYKYKIHILSLISLVTLLIIVFENWNFEKLGLRIDNIQIAFIPYAIFTLLGVVVLFLIAKLLKATPEENFWRDNHFIYGFIILSLLQEFLFRGFLIPKLAVFFHFDFITILI